MPTNENDRRNRQEPVLNKPSLPDHDRRKDPDMHKVQVDPNVAADNIIDGEDPMDREDATAPPDQEFSQILKSGLRASEGRIPDDPNNWLTSEPDKTPEQDPENRGESLPDSDDPDRRG